MRRSAALLSALATLQLAIPAQASSGSGYPTMVAICGSGAPIRLPMKNRSGDQGCCKICHSAMRKRFAVGTSCCGDDDEEDSGS